MKNFIDEATQLINQTPACHGHQARLAHWLSMAVNRLEAVVSQADAQFAAGDKHATFNKQTIDSIKKMD